ncbi:MAG: sel1 repeat family protein [Rhodospirillales bacterium]|nr:sel1 repeat family protein [Rhodospirillales bacterium]
MRNKLSNNFILLAVLLGLPVFFVSAPASWAQENSLILTPPSISKDVCQPLYHRDESLARRDLSALSETQKLELVWLYYGGGVNVARDYTKAVNVLENVLKTTKNSDIRAKALLQKARMLARGQGYPPNHHEAIRVLESATELDEEDVVLELARIHFADENYTEAVKLFEKAARFNNPKATLALAYLYQRGKVEGREGRADRLFALAQNQFLEKIAASDCAYIVQMAELYEQLKTLENHKVTAALWYVEAAKLDDVEAKLKLIEYIEQGFLEGKENIPSAQSLLEEAAALGSEDALFRLGKLYLQSQDKKNADENKAKALEMLEKSAARGEYEAIEALVAAYDGRYEFFRDREKLLYWLEKAAQHKDADNAMLMRYVDVLSEDTDSADDEKIFALYAQAARKEDAEALYNLGEAYRFGIGVEQNPVKALRYYRAAAQKNYSSAFRRLEQVYGCAIGKPANAEKSNTWRQRAAFIGAADTYDDIEQEIAAAQNPKEIVAHYIPIIRRITRSRDSQKNMVFLWLLYNVAGEQDKAQNWLEQAFEKDKRADGAYAGHYAYGMALLESPLIAHDEEKALAYIKIAADRNHDSALKKLGDLEKNKGNISEAITLYEKALSNGNKGASMALARLLKDGRDPERAVKLFTHAADNGDIRAMIALAKLGNDRAPYWFEQALANYPCDDDDILFVAKSYSSGENGAPQDLSKAMQWFERLAGQGKQEPKDIFTLAIILLEAEAGKDEQALKLLSQAHESGYLLATLKLAEFTMNGQYVPKDTDKALSLYETVAKGGNTQAMYELGKFYLAGHVTDASPERARYWLKKAADGGHAMAADMLGAMK